MLFTHVHCIHKISHIYIYIKIVIKLQLYFQEQNLMPQWSFSFLYHGFMKQKIICISLP